MKIYNGFSCLEDVASNFEIDFDKVKDIELIYACYEVGHYEDDAHVIFIQNGQLYEVNGSHCSCYGLEGQWAPEETSLIALLARPNVSEEAKANLKERYKNLIAFC